MRLFRIAIALALSCLTSAPAMAAVLIADGITYELDLLSVTGTTGNFRLDISGVNTATDTEKGRTGINAFAFSDPAIGTATGGTSTGFTFQSGGLNSSGCDGSGNFFCFKNTSAVFQSPLQSAGSLLFSVTSDTIGSWTNWAPDFKIDWVGSKNNYDLVSKDIPLTNCTAGTCPVITPFIPDGAVPEPATWLLMMVGFGMVGAGMRRRTPQQRVSFA